MSVAKCVQALITGDNLGIDPGLFALRALADHDSKGGVDFNLKFSLFPGAARSMRQMKSVERNNAARIGREPLDRVVFHRHRENAEPITMKKKVGLDHCSILSAVDALATAIFLQ